jgi:predicted RNase H-like HicB family nuclease
MEGVGRMADDDGRTADAQDPEGRAARLPEGNQQNPSAPPAEGATDTTDWKAESRKWERQAKSNAEAATKLATLEESQKTEQQKLADRAAQAERRAAEAELKVLRAEVASAKGIPTPLAQRLQGSTREELEADAEELLKTILPAQQQGKPKPPPAGAVAGAGGAPQGGKPEDIFAALIKGG